jgi:Pilus assembly protein, PilO
MTNSTRGRRSSDKKRLTSHLQNPTHLRAFLTSIVLATAYLAIYGPLSASIDESGRRLVVEKKRLEAVRDIERLRDQYANFKDRLPEKSDTNEWVEYVLNGVRRFPLKLVVLSPDAVRDVGPYKAVVLRIELEGSSRDMHDFLKWLETNERLVRVDMVSIQPPIQKTSDLLMRLTVVGVMG